MKQFIEIEFEERKPKEGLTIGFEMVTNWVVIDRDSIVLLRHNERELTTHRGGGDYDVYLLTERGLEELGKDLELISRVER